MDTMNAWGGWLRHALELAAMVAFALSGVMQAAEKRLDPVGVTVVAFLAAFGGGTLRDLLLDVRPFFWVRHVEYVWAILLMSLAAVVFMRRRHLHPTQRVIEIPDALGLGLFTAVGADVAQAAHMPQLVCVLMGVITGVFGGVLRDLACAEIPSAFNSHRPYAVCAFAGGWLYLGLLSLNSPDWLALTACVLTTAGLRGLAVWRKWMLPTWKM